MQQFDDLQFPIEFSPMFESARKKAPSKGDKPEKQDPKDVELPDNPLFIRNDRPIVIPNTFPRKMIVQGVIEVVFVRRIWPFANIMSGHKSQVRRMLCTSQWNFLQEYAGLTGFKPPQGIAPRTTKWYNQHDLIIVHDLIRKDFRHISLDNFKVVAYHPLITISQKKQFVKFYRDLLKKKSQEQLLRMFDR